MADVPKVYYNQDKSEIAEIKSKWWKQEPEQMFRHVFGVVKKIWDYQKYRQTMHLRMARLYHNMEIVSLNAGMFARSAATDNWTSNRVTLNVIKSCIDTAASKIAKSKPRPLYMTEDGNWFAQQKAKKMTSFMDGWFDAEKVYSKGERAFVDMGVWGSGLLKVFPDEREMKVRCERVIIDEIVVDETEGRYGEPRQLHQVKLVFREVIADLYPEFEKEIMMASNGLTAEESSACSADMIKVIESWHLSSGPDADDGMHCISIENCTLFHEKWTRPYFPFAFMRWTPRLLGFYGMGLAEELVGIQLEVNKILRNIQIAQHLMAVPQIWIEASSHIVTAHINNEIGGIKKFTGSPPIFQTPPAMSPEIYQWLENLYRKAYEITGISQMSANSQKPAGVTAAVALRELSDIESERFSLIGIHYENMYLDVANMCLDAMDYLYEKDKSLSINAPDKNFMEVIKWKDVRMPRDSYLVRSYPTSLLPATPAGKLQKIQELIQAGIFDRDEALMLLDYPDVEAVTSLKTAPREDILRLIYKMIYKGEYYTPEPYMNLQLAGQLAQSAYNKARTNNVPDDRLELLRRFMDDVEALLTPDQGPQVVPAVPGGSPEQDVLSGQALPATPPVGELVPFQGAEGAGAPLPAPA